MQIRTGREERIQAVNSSDRQIIFQEITGERIFMPYKQFQYSLFPFPANKSTQIIVNNRFTFIIIIIKYITNRQRCFIIPDGILCVYCAVRRSLSKTFFISLILLMSSSLSLNPLFFSFFFSTHVCRRHIPSSMFVYNNSKSFAYFCVSHAHVCVL